MRNEILVQSIQFSLLVTPPTGNPKDMGRYVEVLPLEGKVMRPGMVATFFAKDTRRKVSGKVDAIVGTPGFQIIDTFAT